MDEKDDFRKKMMEMRDNQQKMVKKMTEAVQYLVGRKVNLTCKEYEREIGKEKKTYKQYYVEDAEFEKEINAITTENRIFPPGTAGTMDMKTFRLNVQVNKDGIVTHVYYG